jgi:catechol 2,3-dioxygenase-like lactoylglutathione lyase family enzyme
VALVSAGLAIAGLSIAAAQSGPKRPKITGVAGFAAKVSDMTEAKNFYGNVLGLDEAFTIKNPIGGTDLTTYKINDKQYVYVAPDLKEPTTENRLLFVSFETDDAKALRSYLASKGVDVPKAIAPDPEGNLTLMVKDPEGNNVQFIQYTSKGVHARNKGRFLSPRRLSDHALHVGYRITDPGKIDTFYKDILGYRLMWKGGGRDDRFDWISMIVPDGNQWIEYMVNTGQPNQPTIRQLGVLNHLALGTTDIEAAYNKVAERGYTAPQPFKPSVGRDGRWLMHLYDKDLTRTEFMIRKPVKDPCCSPLTDVVK